MKYVSNNLTKIEEEAGLSNDDDQPEVPIDDVGDARNEHLVYRKGSDLKNQNRKIKYFCK